MNFIGQDYFPSLAPLDEEYISIDAAKYLLNKTGVSLVSAAWSSLPNRLAFSDQQETGNKSTVKVTVPSDAAAKYDVRCRMVFSDGAERTFCAPLRIDC